MPPDPAAPRALGGGLGFTAGCQLPPLSPPTLPPLLLPLDRSAASAGSLLTLVAAALTGTRGPVLASGAAAQRLPAAARSFARLSADTLALLLRGDSVCEPLTPLEALTEASFGPAVLAAAPTLLPELLAAREPPSLLVLAATHPSACDSQTQSS